MEQWKDIEGYEGMYQVSNLGRVKSLPRPYRTKEKILKGGFDTGGYPHVALRKDNKLQVVRVHVLVAKAFLGHEPCGHQVVVDHLDDDKTNNRVSNLNLTTQRDNCSRRGGSSKYAGVYFFKRDKNWRAYIDIDGKREQLGTYPTEDEAYQARLQKLATL
jgi:hypothetical protein